MGRDTFASLMQSVPGKLPNPGRLRPGTQLEVTVLQVGPEFIYVNAGTPYDGRIPRSELEDAQGQVRVRVGDKLRAACVDARSDGPILRPIVEAAAPNTPAANEVLRAKVTRVEKFGVFISTARGDGLVPLSELPLPPGADHRRLYPIGHEFDVVAFDTTQPRRLRFSATRVARIQEEQNYREFSARPQTAPAAAEPVGSLGVMLQQQLGKAGLEKLTNQAQKQVRSGSGAPRTSAAKPPRR